MNRVGLTTDQPRFREVNPGRPRLVAIFRFGVQREEISSGVCCCPVKVKIDVKNSTTRTALALALFTIFYPKEEVKGRMLHELDQDIIDAITMCIH